MKKLVAKIIITNFAYFYKVNTKSYGQKYS